jgi:transcription elongation factor Elf1
MSTRMQLLCLVLVGLTLAAATSHLRGPVVRREASGTQKYLYCPECGLEMTAPAEAAEGKQTFCPHCGLTHPMQVSSSSRTNGDGPGSQTSWLFVGLMFGVPAALAIGVYGLSRSREQQQVPTAEDDGIEFSCPGCGHTMASKSYRKGSTVVCPICAELFVVTGSDRAGTEMDRADQQRDLEAGLRSKLRKKRPGKPRRPRP